MPLPTLSEEVQRIPFDDLTIICEEKKFRVHSAFVCRKSEVLKKGLVGNFTVRYRNTQSVFTTLY